MASPEKEAVAGAQGNANQPPAVRPLRTANLRVQLAESLRERLELGEWHAGDQLPTEAELAAEYGVSRSTVRSALQQLETLGLTITRHGMGTFVTPYGHAIKAGLQELKSMTDTIRAHGLTPAMDYHLVEFRAPTVEEAATFDIRDANAQVLATQRAVLADDITVAYSYETIPAEFLPANLKPEDVEGSLFALMERAGIVAQMAVAEIGAARGPQIGWGERDPDMLYVDLRQIHYDDKGRPVVQSRTYFHQGRFQFSVLRVR
ncbi:MAG TPA: GntR family transcriptional regulator [Actinomycetales bacterium]|nr:GntR family transcriptional regulator [Actinomycetales bacterium]